MREFRLFLFGGLALMLSSPAWAATNVALPLRDMANKIKTLPNVSAGDRIGIACAALEKSAVGSDVRVVLTVSPTPGDAGPGYQKVLATDALVAHGAVRVRIPTVPDLQDRTVHVNVYVIDNKGAQSCDAGHIKIVRRPTNSAPRSMG